MKNILLLTISLFSLANANAQCLEVTSIFVDACDGGTFEGENEMFTFNVGATAINSSNISVSWPNNSFIGWCQNATTATATSQLNATITNGCGYLQEPTAGLLPANANVIVITSTSINLSANSFNGLSDSLYIIYQCAGNTPGHFANAGTGIRTLTVNTIGPCIGTETVSYNRASLFGGDGATVQFYNAGNDTYVNNGCNAPVVSYNTSWNISDICQDYGAINLNTLLASYATTGGTWTASQGLSSDSIFNPAGLSGPTTVTYSLPNVGTCTANLDSTISFTIDTAKTSESTLQSCDSLYYAGNWFTADTILNVTFSGATSLACDSIVNLAITITSNVIDSNYFEACTNYTFDGVVYTSDTILYDTVSTDGNNAGTCAELFISEYAEGSSNNKYIEIYNGTGVPVNLANYSLERYNNGTGVATPSDVLVLSGILNDGDVFVVYNTNANATISAAGDITSSITFFNGDDAIALYHNATLIDLIGNIGCDPGTNWGTGAFVTKEATIYRNANYTAGVLIDPANAPCDFPTLNATNWTALPQDDFSNIGIHTSNCSGSVSSGCDTIRITNIKISTFTETNSTATICVNDSLFLAGAWQTTANTYHDTFNLSGTSCDSIHHTLLSVQPLLVDSVTTNYCFGTTFNHVLPSGITVSTVGIYNSVIVNASSCDSVITSIIAFNNAPVNTNTRTCTNNPANVSVTIDTLYAVNDCDSLYHTIQTVLLTPTQDTLANSCTTNIALAGFHTDTIYSIGNCDSVYQVTNTVLITPFYSNENDICTNNSNQTKIDTLMTQTSIGGCDSAFSITATIFNLPESENVGDSSICIGQSLEIFGQNRTEERIYLDTITGVLGCDSVIQNFELIVHELPTIFAGGDQNITTGTVVTLSAEGGDTYEWNTNEFNETISVSPTETTTYFVTGTDLNNCINTDSIVITVFAEEVAMKIPTAFTPNNDGVNESFKIVNDFDFEEINMRIYNRWGELVFESNETNTAWNGQYKNILQTVDIYIYYIDAISKATNEKVSVSGSVTLLK